MSTYTQVRNRLSDSRTRRLITEFGYYGVAVLVAGAFLAPLLWSVVRSFSDPLHGWAPTSRYYDELWTAGRGLGHYAANSLIVAVSTTVLTLLLSTLAGYALARTKFPGQNIVFAAMLLPFMVPYQGIMVPIYTIMAKLGLVNSLVGLVLIYTSFMMPFSIFLMRNSFLAIPGEMEEAAIMDGASMFQMLTRVFLPLVVPGLATVALYAFMYGWSDLLAALIMLNNDRNFTLPLALGGLQQGDYGAIDLGVLEAGAIVSMIPCIVLFLILQRYYIRGIAAGAIKL